MEKASAYSYDDYVYPAIRYTHKINQCFSHAFLLLKNHTVEQLHAIPVIKREIAQCCNHILSLKRLIEEFDKSLIKKLTSIFQTIAQHSPKNEKDIIETEIIPNLPQNLSIQKMTSSIASRLLHMHNELCTLNKTGNLTQEQLKNQLYTIKNQYDLLFAQFTIDSSRHSHRHLSLMPMHLVTPPHQDIQNLLREKNNLKYKINNQPSVLKSPKNTINKISMVAHIISWIPVDTLYCIEQVLLRVLGKANCDQMKTTWIFKKLDHLHRRRAINLRAIIADTHGFLAKGITQFILDHFNQSQATKEYIENVQKYCFIEFLECLHRSHHQSIKVLQRENERFAFVYEHEKEFENDINNPDIHQSKEAAPSIFTLDSIKNSISYVASSNVHNIPNQMKHFKDKAIDTARLFCYSLLPWYTVPTNSAMSLAQQSIDLPSIIAQPQIGNIKDFLLNTKPKIGAYLFNSPAEEQMNRLRNMIITHQTLATICNKTYQEHTKNTTDLPKEWDTVSSKIDILYQSLRQLQQDRKNLCWYQIWSKVVNASERNTTTALLQQHINTYNKVKVDLYTKNQPFATNYNNWGHPTTVSSYTQTRNAFLDEFKFTQKDCCDIVKLCQKDTALKQNLHIFNPLERTTLENHIKNLAIE